MNISIKMFNETIGEAAAKVGAVTLMVAALLCVATVSVKPAFAAPIPNFSLSSGATTVAINVTGANSNAEVMFYYLNGSVSTGNSSTQSYTSIDIGRTNQNGSFTVSVAPNSYSLVGGMPVYVSVDGASSAHVSWPAYANTSTQSGSLSLSQQSVTLIEGQSVNIFPMNSAGTMSVQGNSNPLIVSATYQSNNNSIFITGLRAGTTVVTACGSSAGCGSVNVTVQAPTETVAFNKTEAYVVSGQPSQSIGIYGPGSYYGLTNTNKDVITASLSGTNLIVQGIAVGQATISVCADGMKCGSIIVHSLTPGTAAPTQTIVQAPTTSGFNQPPQISSLSVSSNDVLGLFFGAGSTITVSFSTNESVKNVMAKIAGKQVAVTQGNNGAYYATYAATGNDTLPMPIVIVFTDLSGVAGQSYSWIGTSSTLPTGTSAQAASSAAVSSGSGAFTKTLSLGMSNAEVSALQKRLKSDGFFAGSVTGYFGSQTKVAVEKYQKAHGLSSVGSVGVATRKLLNQGI